MSRCQECHKHKHFNCLCHKRPKRECTCHGKCHCSPKLLKDCICIEWTVQPGETQTVFRAGGYERIFASGFVGFDSGNADSVIVRFFLANNQVGQSIRVFEDSSVAFTFTRFDQITVEYPDNGVVPLEPSEGEICIKTRTPIV